MAIELRPLKEEDISVVYQIALESFEYPWSEKRFVETMQLPFIHSMVAINGDEIAGYCYTSVMYDESEIYDIAVSSNYRKKGIGQLLMEEAISFAKEKGAEKMFLEVASKNSSAQALYKKNGFEIDGVRKSYYQNGDDAYNMTLVF